MLNRTQTAHLQACSVPDDASPQTRAAAPRRQRERNVSHGGRGAVAELRIVVDASATRNHCRPSSLSCRAPGRATLRQKAPKRYVHESSCCYCGREHNRFWQSLPPRHYASVDTSSSSTKGQSVVCSMWELGRVPRASLQIQKPGISTLEGHDAPVLRLSCIAVSRIRCGRRQLREVAVHNKAWQVMRVEANQQHTIPSFVVSPQKEPHVEASHKIQLLFPLHVVECSVMSWIPRSRAWAGRRQFRRSRQYFLQHPRMSKSVTHGKRISTTRLASDKAVSERATARGPAADEARQKGLRRLGRETGNMSWRVPFPWG